MYIKLKNVIEKKVIMMLIIAMIIGTFLRPNVVSASVSTSGIVIYESGHNEISKVDYDGYVTGRGEESVTLDTSRTDAIVLPHRIAVESCCNSPSFYRSNYLRILLDGNEIYYTNDFEVLSDIYNVNKVRTLIEIGVRRSTSSKLTYDYLIEDLVCKNCQKTCKSILSFTGPLLYDYRGRAFFSGTSIEVKSSDTVRVAPSYDRYAANVEWGVRLGTVNDFTRLAEGVNDKGIIASGVNSRELVLSNLQGVGSGFDVGVFVYDEFGSLPCGTISSVTPYFIHVNISDDVPPNVDVNKTYDKQNKSVVVSVIASDNASLHTEPYSWDGITFGTTDTRAYTTIGTYDVWVRDASGNISKKSFTIDRLEIEMVNPTGGGDDKPNPEKGEGSDNKPSDNSGGNDKPSDNSGGNDKPDNVDKPNNVDKPDSQNGSSNTDKPEKSDGSEGGDKPGSTETDTKPIFPPKDNNDLNKPTGDGGTNSIPTEKDTTPDKSKSIFKHINDDDDFISEKPVATDSNKSTSVIKTNKETTDKISKDDNNKTTSSDSSKKGTQNGLTPKKVSETDKNTMFDRIRQNSQDYIISMNEVDTSKDEKLSPNDSAKVDMNRMEKDENSSGNNISNINAEEKEYVPKMQTKSPLIWVAVAMILLIALLILAFLLFFGVIVFAMKENEFSDLIDTPGLKVPVGLCLVSFKDGERSVCFRELLDKYGVVYARFGALFNYMYEDEKVNIMTRFKGEEKRTIATEVIHKEITIGSVGGNKK